MENTTLRPSSTVKRKRDSLSQCNTDELQSSYHRQRKKVKNTNHLIVTPRAVSPEKPTDRPRKSAGDKRHFLKQDIRYYLQFQQRKIQLYQPTLPKLLAIFAKKKTLDTLNKTNCRPPKDIRYYFFTKPKKRTFRQPLIKSEFERIESKKKCCSTFNKRYVLISNIKVFFSNALEISTLKPLKIRLKRFPSLKSQEMAKPYSWIRGCGGYCKDRLRNGIAYLYMLSPNEDSIDIVAFDIQSKKRVGQCIYDKLTLSLIEVTKKFQRQGIGLNFIKIAAKYLEEKPHYSKSIDHNSRYRLTPEGSALVSKALKKRIISEEQIYREPLHSPSGYYQAAPYNP